MQLAIFKQKKVYIPLVIALLVIGVPSYRAYKKANAPVAYETVKVERGDLKQTVDAVGKITAENDLSLHFEVPGTVGSVLVKEGAAVSTGTVLASLRLGELDASVAQAQANLNQKLAGPTNEDRSYYEAAVSSAQAAFEQSKIDAANAVATAESAVATALSNLKISEGGTNSQIVTQAYQNAVSNLQATITKLDNGLTQADNVLGIDNVSANDTFESVLSILNVDALNKAKQAYGVAKDARTVARTSISALSINSAQNTVDIALNQTIDSLGKMNTLLFSVSDALGATITGGSLTQSVLDTMKSTVETTRAAVASQATTILTAQQNITNAKNSLDTYTIAYNKSVKDLEQVKANAESSIKIKEALYNQAKATLESKVNPPREVDIASYRAALAQAIANRNKAIIVAPIDGVVTKVNKKVGEQISSADTMINLLSPHYEVHVDMSETDIPKIKIGNAVKITLDAYGSDVAFSGQVIAIDPGATEIQDVVYYKVTIRLDETDKPIKPDMTANVIVSTDARSAALSIPFRSVRTDDSGRYVRVLKNGVDTRVPVTLGLRADGGMVEITNGLSEGDEVILNTKTN